jgi:hypothetical protein
MASLLDDLKGAAENAGGDLSKGLEGGLGDLSKGMEGGLGDLSKGMGNISGDLSKGIEGKLKNSVPGLGAAMTAGNIINTVGNAGKDSEGDKALELLLNTLSTDDFKNKLKDSVANTVNEIIEPVMDEKFKELGNIVNEIEKIQDEVVKNRLEEKVGGVANEIATATTDPDAATASTATADAATATNGKTGGKKSRRRVKSRISRRKARKGYRTTRKSSSRAVQRTRGRK